MDRVAEQNVVDVEKGLRVLVARDIGRAQVLALTGHEPDETVGGPALSELVEDVPVPESELELVPEIAGVEEGRGAEARLVLVVADVKGQLVAAPDATLVDESLIARISARRIGLAGRQVGEVERREQVGRHDLRILDLVGGSRMVGVAGRRQREVITAPAAQCSPLEIGRRERERVRRERLSIELPVQVVERVASLKGFPGFQVEGLAEVVVARESPPDPHAVPPQRAAGLGAVLPARAARIEPARRAAKLVRAAPRHEVQSDARRREVEIRAAGNDGDALEGVEVEEHRRERADVDRNAVEDVAVLLGARPLSGEERLSALRIASDVDVVDSHPRNLPQDRPGIARRRDAVELLAAVGRAGLDLPLVQDRRAADRHRLRRAGHPQRDREGRGLPDADRHGATHRFETRFLEQDGIVAGREAQETKLASRVGTQRFWGARTGQRDADPGNGPSLGVQHRAVQIPGRRKRLPRGTVGKKPRSQNHRKSASRFSLFPKGRGSLLHRRFPRGSRTP